MKLSVSCLGESTHAMKLSVSCLGGESTHAKKLSVSCLEEIENTHAKVQRIPPPLPKLSVSWGAESTHTAIRRPVSCLYLSFLYDSYIFEEYRRTTGRLAFFFKILFSFTDK